MHKRESYNRAQIIWIKNSFLKLKLFIMDYH